MNKYVWTYFQLVSEHDNVVVIWSLSLDLINILKRHFKEPIIFYIF